MQRFKISLTILALSAAAFAQTAAEKPGVDVRRVGSHLQCQCGGCPDSVSTCNMLECGFSKPAKERIAKLQAAGMSDQAIIATFVKEYGQGIYLSDPNAFGWVVPYCAAGLGLGVILLFLRKYRKVQATAVAGPTDIDDLALAKYKDQIEKDLSKLD
jgi:cytochrome c-type biogenesis protein CcmH/NrfF